MSVEKTSSSADELLSVPEFPGPDPADSPDTTRSSLRRTITASGSRLREAAPRRARRAGDVVRHNPVTSAGVLALAGGMIAALVARRRVRRARAAQARKWWLPARFQR